MSLPLKKIVLGIGTSRLTTDKELKLMEGGKYTIKNPSMGKYNILKKSSEKFQLYFI